jgi:hypothetical protein
MEEVRPTAELGTSFRVAHWVILAAEHRAIVETGADLSTGAFP